MTDNWIQRAGRLSAEWVQWRRALHAMPELGMTLDQTVGFVCERLDEMGVRYERVGPGGYGVLAQVGRGERCFLLRSDMDALPIAEQTGEAFAAHNGWMHAHGHDIHTTILLAAACLLKEREDELHGAIKLLFQPGEETFEGAKAMLAAGILEYPRVDAAFAAQVSAVLPAGVVAWGVAPLSGLYAFQITLVGRGGHGAEPERCIDPINTGAHIYLALQELIAREVPSNQRVTLTLGSFTAGDTFNMIPERAVLRGTLYYFDPKIAQRLVTRIQETVQGIAAAYRTQASVEVLSQLPSLRCDWKLCQMCADSVRAISDAIGIRGDFQTMASDDFSYIAERVPSAYFAIGAAIEDGKHTPLNYSTIRFHEGALVIGAAMYARIAKDWLDHHHTERHETERT